MGTSQPLPNHLLPDREIHVVISTLSGQQKAQDYYENTLKAFLDENGLRYSTHTTKSTQTIIELTQNLFIYNASKGVKQTIILLSGDGGIIDIVNTLASTLQRSNDDNRRPSIFIKPTIVLIPQGTANALAWSSGIAHNPLETLMKGRATSVPMFEVTFSPGARLVTNEGLERELIQTLSSSSNAADTTDEDPRIYGAVVFSWGLHASLVAKSDTATYRKHGIDRFKMVAGDLLNENHAYKGIVKIRPADDSSPSQSWIPLSSSSSPNSEPTTSHSYIMTSLVSNLEEKFKISPASQPLSGKLYLIGIPHLSQEELSKLMFLPYQDGKHVHEPQVTYKEIEALRIEFMEEGGEYRLVCIDGKIVEIEEGGWVEVKMLSAGGMDGRRVVELVR